MGVFADGGNFAIRIDGSSVIEDHCGSLGAKTYILSSGAGTYTATTTGYVTFELYNWRDDILSYDVMNYTDNLRMYPQDPNFIALERELVASAGGTTTFELAAGPMYANKPYLVLSGITGCHPGFTLNGVDVPLNPDIWTWQALEITFEGFWSGFYGTLDAGGEAVATLDTFGPQPLVQGMVFHFDYIVLDNPTSTPVFASYPIYVYMR